MGNRGWGNKARFYAFANPRRRTMLGGLPYEYSTLLAIARGNFGWLQWFIWSGGRPTQ